MYSENEELFFKELSNVPPLPDELFGKINRRINRRSWWQKSLIGLAASAIIAVGLSGYALTQKKCATYSPEVAGELQIIHSYINGDDLEQEPDMYAVLDVSE